MRCPVCSNDDTRVVDSRLGAGADTVRRRRECQACQARFNTLERLALEPPKVIKRDRTREAFDEDKLRRGLERALEKRPVDVGTVEATVVGLSRKLSVLGVREVESVVIGEAVMEALIQVDEVAYVRYASVYRRFQDAAAFSEEIRQLASSRDSTIGGDQLSFITDFTIDADDE
ncbi:MAG: transcriptional regulator NrdR [Pseudomonadota bacterium]|nr:transcriptional regulator NrdR [Pseudomonadota bacterium]